MIGNGFAETEREEVGQLYWEAFGRKLSAAFSNPSIGRRVMVACLRRDRVLVARVAGSVAGYVDTTNPGVAQLSSHGIIYVDICRQWLQCGHFLCCLF